MVFEMRHFYRAFRDVRRYSGQKLLHFDLWHRDDDKAAGRIKVVFARIVDNA